MVHLRHDGTRPTASERGHAQAVWNRLLKRYPTIRTALDYRNPWELLVVTVLSAQTTDENVNRVAPVLFGRYPGPEDLANADLDDVERIVFSTGFYRQKASAVIALANDLVERFGGAVPADLDSLVTLDGVGRKTAGVVLAEAWGMPAIAVDTHVGRVAGRLGITSSTQPIRIEQDLKAAYPKEVWAGLTLRLIQFGRDVCHARRPDCPSCEMAKICPWPDKRI